MWKINTHANHNDTKCVIIIQILIPPRYRSRFHPATLPLAIPSRYAAARDSATLPLAIPFHSISFRHSIQSSSKQAGSILETINRNILLSFVNLLFF